jgi:hypothetical protein
MLYKDIETNEIKTKRKWIKELEKEAKENSYDAYSVSGSQLFDALVSDHKLVPQEN